MRPGIVHRLDKDTSGLMMVAKTHQAHQALSEQIKARQVTKGYLALATGMLAPRESRIDAPIARDPRHRKRMAVVSGGRQASTRYRVLESFSGHSLLELYLETGRTHQVRVHLAHLGHPLLGDAVYGRSNPLLGRHFLHAHHLGFRHPATGEAAEFRSGLPEDLAQVVEQLRGGFRSPG
jgi:23S rRNA pseudouridine1911/1915/1917 synthase